MPVMWGSPMRSGKTGVAVLVSALAAAACSDADDAPRPDAAPTSQYNLTCLDREAPTPATDIHIAGYLVHITTPTDAGGLADVEVEVQTVDGATTIASGVSADNAVFNVDIDGEWYGTQARLAFQPGSPINPTDPLWPKQRWYSSRPLARSIEEQAGDFLFSGARRERMLAIAESLEQTLDETKGVVEVWLLDCVNDDMPGATVSIDEATDLDWTMQVGTGAWVPGETTMPAPQDRAESLAATVNVEPGLKHVSVVADGTMIGPVPFYVDADSYNIVLVLPGFTLLGPGF